MGDFMNWPKKIERIKKELNCSTAELTRKLGFEGQYVTDIEKGRSKNPSSKFIANLIKIGVNPLWIFLDQGDVFLGVDSNTEKIKHLEQENKELVKKMGDSAISVTEAVSLLNDIMRLKTKQIPAVKKYLKSLADKQSLR